MVRERISLAELLPHESPITHDMAEMVDVFAGRAERARELLESASTLDLARELWTPTDGFNANVLLHYEDLDERAEWVIGAWGLVRLGPVLVRVVFDGDGHFRDLVAEPAAGERAAASVTKAFRDLLWLVSHLAVKDRELLANRQVRMEDEVLVSTPGHRILRVPPVVARAMLRPGKPLSVNWRATTLRAMKSLGRVSVQNWCRPGARLRNWQPSARGWSSPVEWVMAGDELATSWEEEDEDYEEREHDKALDPLVNAILDGSPSDRGAFYVSLGSPFWRRMMPRAVDDKGKSHWGYDAVRVLKTRAKNLSPKDRNDEFDRIATLKRPSQYFTDSLGLRVLGELEKWPSEAKRLLEVLQRQRPGKVDATHRTLEGFTAYNGMKGYGFSLSTWTDWCWPDGMAASRRKLLTAMRFLNDELNLQIEIKGDEELDSEECLDFIGARLRRRGLGREILRFHLPTILDQVVAECLRDEPQQVPSGYSARDEKPGMILRVRRRRLGLTQQQVAEALDVSSSLVSQWETGALSIPEQRRPLLAAVLDEAEKGKSKQLNSLRSAMRA
jgi:hypothetical protein